MTATALALVLTAAVFHAGWNVAARRVRGVDGGLFVFAYAAGSAALWIPVAAGWLLIHPHRPAWSWLGASVVSGLLHTAYGVVLQRGYARGDLNLVYPIARGVGPLLTLVVAGTVLQERLAPAAVLGALTIVAGIGVISLLARAVPREHLAIVGVGWGAATGVCIAGYTLWDAHSVSALHVPPLPYFAISLVFQLVPLTSRAWRRRAELLAVFRQAGREVATVSVFSPLAYVLVLKAMLIAPVALVASTRETSIVLGALFGRLLFGEPGGVRRVLGALVVLAGIVLVARG